MRDPQSVVSSVAAAPSANPPPKTTPLIATPPTRTAISPWSTTMTAHILPTRAPTDTAGGNIVMGGSLGVGRSAHQVLMHTRRCQRHRGRISCAWGACSEVRESTLLLAHQCICSFSFFSATRVEYLLLISDEESILIFIIMFLFFFWSVGLYGRFRFINTPSFLYWLFFWCVWVWVFLCVFFLRFIHQGRNRQNSPTWDLVFFHEFFFFRSFIILAFREREREREREEKCDVGSGANRNFFLII